MEPMLPIPDQHHPLARMYETPGGAIDTLILKVASRCNMNCEYCYMYNLADTTWRRQPRFMCDETFSRAIGHWKDHSRDKGLKRLHLVIHGGEPLLAGTGRLDHWMALSRREFRDTGIQLSIGLQTNGLLIDDEFCAVLDRHEARFGVSIDGVPGKGDLLRVDHAGRPTGRRVEERLRWLKSSRWGHTLGGILSVVNIACDPVETVEYVLGFGPENCDFRLPLCNHDSPPFRPRWDTDGTSYGRWLARVLDYAIEKNVPCRVRVLDAVINAGVNEQAYQNLIGNTELTQACVVETDGSYELPDNLKSTCEGMTKTGLSVYSDTLDKFSGHAAAWARDHGLASLIASGGRCPTCPLYDRCRGFYYANRYSSANLFNNESVYCTDLVYLFNYLSKFRIHSARPSSDPRPQF